MVDKCLNIIILKVYLPVTVTDNNYVTYNLGALFLRKNWILNLTN